MRTTPLTRPHQQRPPVTDAQVLAALLAELDRLEAAHPDELHRLLPIRRRLPGTWNQQLRMIEQAVASGEVSLVKVHGSPLVQRGDDTDRKYAASCRARGKHPAHLAS